MSLLSRIQHNGMLVQYKSFKMYVVQYNTKYITGTRQDKSLLHNSLDTDRGKMGYVEQNNIQWKFSSEIFSPRSYNVYSQSSQNSHINKVWCQVTHFVNTQQNIHNVNTDDNI